MVLHLGGVLDLRDEGRRDLKFEVGDLVMVFLNKDRLQKGIPGRIGPCKVLAKYGPKYYKMELPKEISISPIFNVKELIKYKGPKMNDE